MSGLIVGHVDPLDDLGKSRGGPQWIERGIYVKEKEPRRIFVESTLE
jgi:hypothetical protein